MASNFSSNSSVSESPIDFFNSQEQQQVSQQEQQQDSQQEQQQDSQQEQQPDSQQEQQQDSQQEQQQDSQQDEEHDENENSDSSQDGGDSDNHSQGNFFEENKSLLTKVYNILKLKFPSLNISLSELITAAQKHIDMYASNPGHGSGNGDVGEGDEPKPEIDLSQFTDDDIDAIVKGFCKIYSTDYNTFHQKIVSKETNINNLDYDYHANQYPPNLTKELCDILNNRDCTDRFKEELHQQEIIRVKKLNKALNDIVDSMNKDVSLRLKPKEALTKYCLKDVAVLDYIEYLLKIYFDKWLLPDGSGDRFPYVIKGPTDTAPREKNEKITEEWQDILPTIMDIEKSYNNEKNKRFIKIENEYPEVVYYCKSDKKEDADGEYILFSKDDRKKFSPIQNTDPNYNWYQKEANGDYKKTYDLQLYYDTKNEYVNNIDINTRFGKACSEMMQDVAKELLKRFEALKNDKNQSRLTKLEDFFKGRYKKVYEANENRYRFKDYLHDFGIGMDCSGYVSRAIAFVMNKLEIPGWAQIETLGPGYGRLKTNDTTLEGKGHSTLVEEKVKKTIENGKKTYKIRDVSNIHPGDITINSSHIRIICEVDTNNNFFKVHESGSNGIKGSLRESERIGITQTKVLDWIEKEPYTWEENNEIITSYTQKIKTGSYSIRRPVAFENPNKLREYFKNMLIAKGKEPN